MVYDVVFEKFPFIRVEAEDQADAARCARRKASKIIKEENRNQIALDLRIVEIKEIRY
jgi:hypothetical protein